MLPTALISKSRAHFLPSDICSNSTTSSVNWLPNCCTVCCRNKCSLFSHFWRKMKAARSSCKQHSQMCRGNSTMWSFASTTSKSHRTFVHKHIKSEYVKFASNVNASMPVTRSNRFVISSLSFKQHRQIFSKNTVFILFAREFFPRFKLIHEKVLKQYKLRFDKISNKM